MFLENQILQHTVLEWFRIISLYI